MKDELVMFSFQHFQFAGIHAGIQSGHCWTDMAVKYRGTAFRGDTRSIMYWDWAEKHKTVNIRNGGDQDGLIDIIRLFQRVDNPYPWQQWREDSSCNECLTNVSIVVPSKVYGWKPIKPISISRGWETITKCDNELDSFDRELYNLISRTRHAI